MTFDKLTDRITVVTAWYLIDENPVPANYLVVEGDESSLLIDSPWDDVLTNELLIWADSTLKKPIRSAIITHAHIDRMGGIHALHEKGVTTYIQARAQAENHRTQEFDEAQIVTDSNDVLLHLGTINVTIIYPGDGHAPGNTVVMVDDYLLYGGCFLKSASSPNLGNTADANLSSWADALKKVEPYTRHANWVIPGHGPYTDGAFERTVELVMKANSRN